MFEPIWIDVQRPRQLTNIVTASDFTLEGVEPQPERLRVPIDRFRRKPWQEFVSIDSVCCQLGEGLFQAPTTNGLVGFVQSIFESNLVSCIIRYRPIPSHFAQSWPQSGE